MEERVYLLTIKVTSQDQEQRELTPYDDIDTAERKWHEAFNTIGGGPKYIASTVLDRYFNTARGMSRVWQQAAEPNQE